MIAQVHLIALAALVPAMTGPVQSADAPPDEGAEGIVLALCHGGALVLARDENGVPARGAAPCCAKGCQSRERKRQKIDPAQ